MQQNKNNGMAPTSLEKVEILKKYENSPDPEMGPNKILRNQQEIRIRVDPKIFSDPDPAWIQKNAMIWILSNLLSV